MNYNYLSIQDDFMFLNELNEPQLLVIYSGRFQPFHIGHAKVYEYLAGKFGRNNVFIVTSDKVEAPKSPFSFSEKSYFMQLTGVAADRIIQCSQPYQIEKIMETGRISVADPSNTVVIFAVSEKDMAEDPRFKSWTKKDGTPAYFQPMPKNIKDTEGMNHHGYIMTVPTFDFTVLGQPMRSGSELRALYQTANEQQRQAIIKDLFGKYTQEAEQLLTSKLAPQAPVEAPRPTKLPKTAKPAGGQVAEGVFDVFKKKAKPQMLPLTQEQRNFIKKYFTSHNADIKWGGDGSEYVLPHNVNAMHGRGRFHFRNEDGQCPSQSSDNQD